MQDLKKDLRFTHSYTNTITHRLEVLHNSVQWGKMFEFECRTAVNSLSGVLDDCLCRLSVRKDTKGGRSYQKVGYVDLNLSEYAGSGYVTRHCLLEGYMNKDNKLDNSLLKVSHNYLGPNGTLLPL
ncbi:protein FAM102A-like [Salmo trutta]|uniref:protein FAM102A-like n=1 Tax=Salmo trutta TaxID=8032 RepID=UPI0011315152|nr:protein FAM102A-like [Salmo trutta]